MHDLYYEEIKKKKKKGATISGVKAFQLYSKFTFLVFPRR